MSHFNDSGCFFVPGLFRRVIFDVANQVVTYGNRNYVQIAGTGGSCGVDNVFQQTVAWRHQLAYA